jgi:flavin-dependent dehydrogenase
MWMPVPYLVTAATDMGWQRHRTDCQRRIGNERLTDTGIDHHPGSRVYAGILEFSRMVMGRLESEGVELSVDHTAKAFHVVNGRIVSVDEHEGQEVEIEFVE